MANRYAVGASWNDGTNGWATSSGGTPGAAVPTSSDDVFFDANSVSMSIDVNAVCKSIDSTGFTATLTQNTTRTLTVSGNITWAAGTFVGGDANIDLNIGSFILSGGSFLSTSATFIVRNVWTHTAGGTWNHNHGKVSFGNIDWAHGFDIDVATSETFFDLRVACYYGYNCTIASGDTLVVESVFTHEAGTLNAGTIEVKGAVVVLGSGGGNTLLHFTGSLSQVVVGGTNMATGGFDIDKTGGVVSLGTGDLQIGSLIIRAGNAFISTTGTLKVQRNWTNNAGGSFVHNGGTVQFGDNGVASHGTIDSNGTETFYNLITVRFDEYQSILTAGQTVVVVNNFTHSSGYLQNGTVQVQGNCTIGASAKGGTTAIQFTGANVTQTFTDNGGTKVSGTVTVNKTTGSVVLATAMSFNNTGQDLTITSGTLDLAGFNLTVNDVLTVSSGATLKLKGNGTVTAATKTLSTGSTIQYYDSSVTAVLSNLGVTTFSNLTLGASKTHNFTAGTTYTVNGTLKSDGYHTTQAVLASTTPTSHWNLNLAGTSVLDGGADITDCDASSGSEVSAVGSNDGGNNHNIDFGAAGGAGGGSNFNGGFN